MPIETFNISFESTENKQQYGSKVINYAELKKLLYIFCSFDISSLSTVSLFPSFSGRILVGKKSDLVHNSLKHTLASTSTLLI